jgi:beta-galactosidase
VIEHVGHENTRVFREVTTLGKELAGLVDTLLDSRVESRVGIIFDWDNWWALEMSTGPTVALRYLPHVNAWHEAFWAQNIAVDLIGAADDLGRYDVVIAPVLYMVKPGMAARITDFVRRGGTFLTTFFSGIVNETDLVTLGGHPGELRKLLGIWVEEIDALLPDSRNSIVMTRPAGTLSGSFECGIVCDVLHAEGAEVCAVYGADFYKGMPCLTRNTVGKGEAWYVGSSPDRLFLHGLARHLAAGKGIEPVLRASPGVEATRRRKGPDTFLFVLNHNDEPVQIDLGVRQLTDLLERAPVTGTVTLAAKAVMVLKE